MRLCFGIVGKVFGCIGVRDEKSCCKSAERHQPYRVRESQLSWTGPNVFLIADKFLGPVRQPVMSLCRGLARHGLRGVESRFLLRAAHRYLMRQIAFLRKGSRYENHPK